MLESSVCMLASRMRAWSSATVTSAPKAGFPGCRAIPDASESRGTGSKLREPTSAATLATSASSSPATAIALRPRVPAGFNAARQLLERGQDAPKQVAARCGFADADTLRRAFTRHVGVTPAEYRKRFAVVNG